MKQPYFQVTGNIHFNQLFKPSQRVLDLSPRARRQAMLSRVLRKQAGDKAAARRHNVQYQIFQSSLLVDVLFFGIAILHIYSLVSKYKYF